MSEIKVNGRIKVKSFYNTFIKEFPYLHASLRLPDGKAADMDDTIASVRTKSLGEYKPSGEADLSVRGNLNVGTFEKRFKDTFGITCEIHYKSKSGNWTSSKKTMDSRTLNEANDWVKEHEGEKLEGF